MKELNPKNVDRIENVKQTKREQQTIFSHTSRPQKNHILYQWSFDTKTLTVAEYKPRDTVITWEDAVKGLISTKRKVIIVPNCEYVTAMNENSALKKLRKLGIDC